MIKGPGSSSTVDETDTPLVLGKEKTGIASPTPSRDANGLGGLPVSLAVAIEVSFSYSGPRLLQTPTGWTSIVKRSRPIGPKSARNLISADQSHHRQHNVARNFRR